MILSAAIPQAVGSTVTWIDVATFGIYVLGTLAFGMWVGGRQKDLKTYLLAGHQMHWRGKLQP